MLKIYEKYIIKNFINKFFLISLIFLSLIIILSILEEISFFKNSEVNFMFPYFLTFLSAPITLFEIFPFIFLISTQFLFFDLFNKDELNHMKNNGLSNLKIIKILFLSSISIGIITVLIFYNVASSLKFIYTDIKNKFSKDNKYLAVVTENGLWLKDEIENSVIIIKAKSIKNDDLGDVIINQFDQNFDLERIIQANSVNISKKKWIIKNPTITSKNISNKDILAEQQRLQQRQRETSRDNYL